MSNLSVFQFDSQEVRVVEGKPVANDVAAVLGYGKTPYGDLDCFHLHDILAIAVELASDGKTEMSEKALQLVRKIGLAEDATTERLYHACRIFQAWATQCSDRKEQVSYVYLIGCKKNNTMKIGFSNNPQKRLQGLQVSSPHPLSILATIKGGQPLERKLHKEFAHLKLSGEWFKWDNSIVSRFNLMSNITK